MAMHAYAVFLRGINVGGNKSVPMAALKKTFGVAGMKNVRTLLNSGNVIFESSEKNPEKLANMLEHAFEKEFGFSSAMQAIPAEDIAAIVKSAPFRSVKVDKDTLLYVTFVPGKKPLFTVVKRGEKTTDMMAEAMKKYGKDITTRNWNTVLKIHALLSE